MGTEFLSLFIPVAPLFTIGAILGLLLEKTRARFWPLFALMLLGGGTVLVRALIDERSQQVFAVEGFILLGITIPVAAVFILWSGAKTRAEQSSWSDNR